MYQTKNMGLNITEMPKDTNMAFSFHTDLGYNFEAIDNLALSHRNISNCVLEIPQDIKLELVDGVLTLKEGSKVYVPNGENNFEEFKKIIYKGTDIDSRNFDSIRESMIQNKTTWSMRVFASEKKITYPSYILKAIGVSVEEEF